MATLRDLGWAVADQSGLYLWRRTGGFVALARPPPLAELFLADHNAAAALCAELRRRFPRMRPYPVRLRA